MGISSELRRLYVSLWLSFDTSRHSISPPFRGVFLHQCTCLQDPGLPQYSCCIFPSPVSQGRNVNAQRSGIGSVTVPVHAEWHPVAADTLGTHSKHKPRARHTANTRMEEPRCDGIVIVMSKLTEELMQSFGWVIRSIGGGPPLHIPAIKYRIYPF